MSPFHVQSKVCIAPIHVWSNFADFAHHMDGSNADVALHIERSHADFALHIEWKDSFRDQKIAQIGISAKFLIAICLSYLYLRSLYDLCDRF